MTGDPTSFYAVTRYDEVVEISRRPAGLLLRARARRAIADMPAEALEFFGSFIAMDDPRHARQRGIVARSFTPRQLAGRARLGRDDLHRGHRRHVRAGRGRPRRGGVAAVPAADHLRHDGHPPQRVRDRARRHQRDPRRPATPTCIGGRRASSRRMFDAGHAAHQADERAGRGPAGTNPADDLTSALVHNDVGEDMLAPNEIAPVLHPPRGGRQRHHPHGDQPRHEPAGRRTPTSGRSGRTTSTASPPTAVEEIVRVASPVTFMRRTVTHDLTLSGQDFSEGDKLDPLLRRRQPRPARVRRPRALRRAPRPEPARRLRRARARTSASAPTSPGASWRSCSASCSPASPTSRWPATRCRSQALGIPLVGGIKHLPVRVHPHRTRVGAS